LHYEYFAQKVKGELVLKVSQRSREKFGAKRNRTIFIGRLYIPWLFRRNHDLFSSFDV